MDALITRMVAERPVVMFSRSTCDICHSIESLIRGFGANPTVYMLDQIPNGQEIERAMRQRRCDPSVPAVFIGQEFVGGEKQVMTLLVNNQLGPMLVRAGAIWIWNKY